MNIQRNVPQKKPCLIVHIGMPKTGTTSVQENLFAALSDFNYFGQTNLWENSDAERILRCVLTDHLPDEKARESVSAIFSKNDNCNIISDEVIFIGNHCRRGKDWEITTNHDVRAERLSRVLGRNVKILVVLRKQSDFLVSWHRQGLKVGDYTETNFDRWRNIELGPRRFSQLCELLNYDSLWQSYTRYFGVENVRVALYEAIKSDIYTYFVNELAPYAKSEISFDTADLAVANHTGNMFVNLPPVIRRIKDHRLVKPAISVFGKKFRGAIKRSLSKEIVYHPADKKVLDEIQSHFSETNRRLCKNAGLDGSAFGYY